MAHQRPRVVVRTVKEALSFSPLVGIFGQRQVGKTTLVEALAGNSYFTLDDEDTLNAVSNGPRDFIDQFQKLTAIDECQMAPVLFPALKLRVQKNKRPGQFLLTGSVRFTSRKAIEESLTGRLHSIEVLPLTIAEMHRRPVDDFTQWTALSSAALQSKCDSKLAWFGDSELAAFLSHGGLPGTCFLRMARHRNAKFKSHLQTLLQRDIRLVLQTSVPYANIISLLTYLARVQGTPFVIREGARTAGIAENTVKKLVFAFESMFLIRRILGSADRTGEVFYFEDQGMASYLAPHPFVSSEFRFAFSQLYAQAHYNFMNEFVLSYFETKGGAYAPWLFDIRGRVYAFILASSGGYSRSTKRICEAVLSRYSNAQIFILSSSRQALRVSRSILQIPLFAIV